MLDGATFLSIYLLFSLPVLITSRGGRGGRGSRGGRRGGGPRRRSYYSSGSVYTGKSYKTCTITPSTSIILTNKYVPKEVSCHYGCCSTECCPWYSDTNTMVCVIFLVVLVTATVIYVCKKSWEKGSQTIYSEYQKRCPLSETDDLTTNIVTESSSDGDSYLNETFPQLNDHPPFQKKQSY